MAAETYEDILNLAQALTAEQQERLIVDLARNSARSTSSEFKTVGEAWRARGFIGTITNGPADLSTNPKYMEGFGEDGD